MAAPRPAKVAKVYPPIKLQPATAAPRPAQVSPPYKLPVLDERLRISTSKCLRCMMCRLTLLWPSLRVHLGVVTTRP